MSEEQSTALKTKPAGYLQSASEEWGAVKARVLRDTIAKDLSAPEFSLFVEVCRAKKLDPFSGQIYAVKRWDNQAGAYRVTFQTGIDGFRSLAQRTGEYRGQEGPYWCGADGEWHDVWLHSTPPAAAKVLVFRKGFEKPVAGIAKFDEYAQTKKGGGLVHMWQKLSSHMVAKCAEAIALRRAFPDELSGLYTVDEMAQATNEEYLNEVNKALDDANKSTAPLDEEEPVDVEYQVVNRGAAKANGAGATRVLLQYVEALDSCETNEDVDEVVAAWEDRLDKLPRGKEYIDAYTQHSRARVDPELVDDSDPQLVQALEAMRDATKAVAQQKAEAEAASKNEDTAFPPPAEEEKQEVSEDED